MIAAACSPAVTEDTAAPATAAPEPGATAAPAPDITTAEFVPGPLGAVTIAPGDPIVIADIEVLTTADAPLGQDQADGIDVILARINNEWLGHPVKLTHEDDACSQEGGQLAGQKVVSDPQLVGIIGTSCSLAGVAVSQVMSPLGLVQISGSNTSPMLTSVLGEAGEAWNPGYFRISHNDEHQGKAAATYAYDELGSRNAGVMHSGGPYSGGLAGAFRVAFEALGGAIAEYTAVEKDATDVRPVLQTFEAKEVDLIFFPVFTSNATALVTQVGEFPGLAETVLFTTDAEFSAVFVEIPEALGSYISGPATPTNDAYKAFVVEYEALVGTDPVAGFHAHAADAISLLLDKIAEVAVVGDDGTLYIDRQALRDALYATSNYDGLTGSLTCDEFGDCAAVAIDVMQNNAGTMDGLRGNVVYTYTP